MFGHNFENVSKSTTLQIDKLQSFYQTRPLYQTMSVKTIQKLMWDIYDLIQ